VNIFKKLGFIKGDEGGSYIANKAIKISWLFYNIALLLWSVVELIQSRELTFVFIILLAGQIVFWGFYLYYLKKTSG